MHQICDWAKYHEFTLYFVTYEPMKKPRLSAHQNDHLIFVKDININVHILIGFKVVTKNTNLMHHTLYTLYTSYKKLRKYHQRFGPNVVVRCLSCVWYLPLKLFFQIL